MVDATPVTLALDGRVWGCIDFLSDLHLQATEPSTQRAFLNHLGQTPAQALFILGDLFEVWVGDDLLNDPKGAFEQSCVQALAQASQRLALFWLPGNRDFLTGSAFARACGATPLAETCRLQLPHEVCLLSHGDALCLQDHDYMAFRRQVRSPQWQAQFLAQPLKHRLALARQMRQQSQARQMTLAGDADVDPEAAREILRQAGATHLIHGHTHRPGDHDLGAGMRRTVLSDWRLDGLPTRAQVLRWQAGAPGWHRLAVTG
ncbi:MAG: UDP-2,3-diacylglucosamine diphosphatase [Alphaproteobacteria bacterium]|nr:UDP-2,3-diacylglucosamine diphosphatase [Alphaproteobacteria bacterium]